MAPRMQRSGSMRDGTIPLGTADGRVMPLARPDRRRFGARFGEYEVLAPLANGGMGGVYLASHVVTGDRVALKVLAPQFVDHREVVTRLYNEQALASRSRRIRRGGRRWSSSPRSSPSSPTWRSRARRCG